MSWLQRLFKREAPSGQVAKNRLQVVLSHDRSDITPGLIEIIKDDMIDVIAQHLAIDRDSVVVNLTRSANESRLVAEIPLQSNARRNRY